MKGQKAKDIPRKYEPKETGVAITLSEKIDFMPKYH